MLEYTKRQVYVLFGVLFVLIFLTLHCLLSFSLEQIGGITIQNEKSKSQHPDKRILAMAENIVTLSDKNEGMDKELTQSKKIQHHSHQESSNSYQPNQLFNNPLSTSPSFPSSETEEKPPFHAGGIYFDPENPSYLPDGPLPPPPSEEEFNKYLEMQKMKYSDLPPRRRRSWRRY